MRHLEFLLDQYRKAVEGGYVYLAKAIRMNIMIHTKRMVKERIQIRISL